MLQLNNHSPFKSTITLFPDENGIDTLYVIVKATFNFKDQLSLASDQVPPCSEDEYWGEPGKSSLKYMSEMHLGKPSTDIIVVGHAYAPNEQAVTSLKCGIKIGEYSKTIMVFGDRVWQDSKISSPEPFTKMPLIYENAFGGVYFDNVKNGKGDYKQLEVFHAANPVGCGFRKPKAKATDGDRLPNLEHSETLIQSPNDQPDPVGFGFISPTWVPRVQFSGTYNDSWQKDRAPYLPQDFDNQFFNAANKDLVAAAYLQGGEPVVLVNLSQEKHIKFNLPDCELTCEVNIAGSLETPDLNLETVLIEPDDNRLCMTWRAQLNCDKKALKIKEVQIHGSWTDQKEAISL